MTTDETSLKNRIAELEKELAAAHGRERELRDLLDTSRAAVFTVSGGQGSAADYISAAIKPLLGYAPEEWVDRPELWEASLHPEDATRVKERYRRARETGRRFSCEYRLRSKTGDWVWVREENRFTRWSPDGRQVIRGTLTDITPFKDLEAALEEYRQAVESSRDIIAVVDRDYTYRLVNQAFLDYRRLTREEVQGRLVADVLGRDLYEERVGPALDRSLAGEPVEYEATVDYPDLGQRTIRVSYTPLIDPGDGVPGVVAILRDITASRQATDQLLLFRRLIDQTTDMVAAFDAETGLVWGINKAGCELMRLSLEEALEYAIWDLDTNIDGPAEWRRIVDHLARVGTSIAVRTYRRRDGSTLPVEISGRLVDHPNGRVVITVTRDITRRIERESARRRMEARLRKTQKMEALGTMAGGIAHDFNNILGTIVGCSELIRASLPGGSTAAQDADQVLKAANRAKGLIKQILSYSRQSAWQRQPVEVLPIIKESVKLLDLNRPTSIIVRAEYHLKEAVIECDPTDIHRIITNLCANALAAMASAGGELTVAVRPVELPGEERSWAESEPPDGSYVLLTVADTGPGIEPQHLERIFDPFFTTKRSDRASGLGLSVVHGLVTELGGAVRVDSEPGRGAAFQVLLPRVAGLS